MIYTEAMANELIDQLERIVVGSVAITGRAIAGADADLTLMQWRVLFVVGERHEGSAVGEIAARIGAHASPTSRLVSRLKRRGLVQTDRKDRDARIVRVSLTEAGRELRTNVLGRREKDLAAVLAASSVTAADADTIARLAQSFGLLA